MIKSLSLGYKVVFAVVLTLIVLNGGFGLYQYQMLKADLEQKLIDKTNHVGERLKVNLRDPIWNMDSEAINAILQAELKDIELQGINVKVDNKNIAGFKRDNQNGQITQTLEPSQSHLTIDVTKEDAGKQQIIGTANIAIHRQVIESTLNNELINALFSSLILIVLLSGVITYSIRQLVISPLKQTMNEIDHVRQSGDFAYRLSVKSDDEIGQLASTMNHLLNEQDKALEEIESVMSAVAKGQFDHRINANLTGDLGNIAQKINATVTQLDDAFADILLVMKSLSEGNFHPSQSNKHYEGAFAQVQQSIKTTTHGLDTAIESINNVLSTMAQGQFDQRINVNLCGELNELKININSSIDSIELALNALNKALEQLKSGNLNNQIKDNLTGSFQDMASAYNAALTKTAQSLSIVYESAHSGIDRSHLVASNAEQLSGRTQAQAASIEEVASTMEEMTSAFQQSAENAASVNDLAVQASQEVAESMSIMSKTIHSMNLIESSSEKIAAITSLIDSIAFQTNLLALNAAVEAARAGDHGRGFAVVASEVRNLAQKSADAAKEISTLIADSVGKIQEGTRQASLAGQTLEKATNSVSKVSNIIKDISHASHEQKAGIHQVKQAMSMIDVAVQESVQMSESNTNASLEMQDEMNKLIASINQFQFNRNENKRLSAPTKPKMLRQF